MSSNNQIIIRKLKSRRRKRFIVYHDMCVDNPFVPSKSSEISKAESLEEAIRIANKFIRENIVEYGIEFIGI